MQDADKTGGRINKHHITLDNSSTLLYTVNKMRRDVEHENYNQYFFDGSDL